MGDGKEVGGADDEKEVRWVMKGRGMCCVMVSRLG